MRQAMRALLFLVAGAAAVMVLDRFAGASHGSTAPTAGLELCATPKGQVMLAGAGGCGPGTTSAGVVAHQQSADDAFAHIGALESGLAVLEADNASLKSKVSTLESDNTALQSRISELEATFAGVTRTGSVLTFSRMNLQVVNGEGATDEINGLGNIIIGYNEDRPDWDREGATARSGSHYLVVGDRQNWTRWGGIVAGYNNTASGNWASVLGGMENTAAGDWASVSGGWGNSALGERASVTGGGNNTASGDRASVTGGGHNTASGERASVTGGWFNIASGLTASVSGGNDSTASGWYSSVSGGTSNTASGDWASISGGGSNTASDSAASVSGGFKHSAPGAYDWVAGNLFQDH